MFRNHFMIYYRRHKYFCPISVYIFTKQRCEYFLEIISVNFTNHLCRGRNWENSLLLRNRNISCNEYKKSKRINLYFVCKSSTCCRSNGGTIHFVLCETKPDNLSMLCITMFLCCVWQFFYVVYAIFWIFFFVYIMYVIKSDLNFFYTLYNTFYIIQLKKYLS